MSENNVQIVNAIQNTYLTSFELYAFVKLMISLCVVMLKRINICSCPKAYRILCYSVEKGVKIFLLFPDELEIKR
jgi:hypothetical protein